MEKIIFLDIDGVLNCGNTFVETNGLRKAFNIILKEVNNKDLYSKIFLKEMLLEIDYNKLILLKEIVDLTGAKIVISSSWRMLMSYPLVEEYLVSLGLPIIGVTPKLNNRGEEIDSYIKENGIKNYIIIDDEVFSDFTEEQKFNLVKTNFYQDGLNEESVSEATRKLGLKK